VAITEIVTDQGVRSLVKAYEAQAFAWPTTFRCKDPHVKAFIRGVTEQKNANCSHPKELDVIRRSSYLDARGSKTRKQPIWASRSPLLDDIQKIRRTAF